MCLLEWKTNTGEYSCTLLAAKKRIAPKRQLTFPRMEMCGAVLGSKYQESITEEFEISFAIIIHMIDSMIVQAQIQKEIHRFKPFVVTRSSEI